MADMKSESLNPEEMNKYLNKQIEVLSNNIIKKQRKIDELNTKIEKYNDKYMKVLRNRPYITNCREFINQSNI